MKKANILSALIGMFFSAAVFYMTLGFRQFKNVPIGPDFFPRYLAGCLFVCSSVLLIQALGFRPKNPKPAPTISLRDRGIQRLLVGIGIILVYALCWDILGFIIATPLALFALMFLLGLRRYRVMILFAFGAMILIFSAFRFFLGIDMPLGLLEGIL